MCDIRQTTMSVLPFEKKEKQAIIFIGIQACGKTTFYYRMLSDGNYAHISLDDLHTRNKESQELMKCLESGNSFVIDNTNPEIPDRATYIQKAKEHGYQVIGIFFQSRVKDCVRRNEERGGKVPSKAIACTSNKL
jgi:predicted kinase